jgi:hypothetical protein
MQQRLPRRRRRLLPLQRCRGAGSWRHKLCLPGRHLGNASQAATTPATYTLSDVLYAYSTFDGEQRLRIKPRAAIRPGDTVRYGETFFTVGMVLFMAAKEGVSMEIATTPSQSGAAGDWPCSSAFTTSFDDLDKWQYTNDFTFPKVLEIPPISDGVLTLSHSTDGAAWIRSPAMRAPGTITFDLKIEISSQVPRQKPSRQKRQFQLLFARMTLKEKNLGTNVAVAVLGFVPGGVPELAQFAVLDAAKPAVKAVVHACARQFLAVGFPPER